MDVVMKCPTRGKRFYCREWVFNKILNIIDSTSSCSNLLSSTTQRPSSSTSSSKSINIEYCSNVISIVGGPGCGKTAICGEIVWPTIVISRQSELNSRLLAYHFCRLDDSTTLSTSAFVLNLVKQLIDNERLPDFKQRLFSEEKRKVWLSEVDNIPVRRAEQFPDEAFRKTILEPLNEVEIPKNNLFVLVDLAHDDSCSGSDYVCATSGIAELLVIFRRELPKWLTLVITSRRQCTLISRAFRNSHRVILDDLRRSCVVRDIQQYILHRLDEDEQLRMQLNMETAEMLNRLHIKSNGCILYLELVLDGVVDGFAALNESQHIPSTLNGLYLWLCQRLFPRKHYFTKIQPLFDVMLATKRPLTADELFQCVRTSDVDVPVDEFLERMKSISRLLWIDDERCTWFHHSFAEWLSDVKYSTQKYVCDKAAGHSYLAMWYSARGPDLSLNECLEFAYHLSKMKIKPPLDESHLPLWLVQSGAPVQQLVLANFAYDEATTRLLIDAGADFVSLDFQRSPNRLFHDEDDRSISIDNGQRLSKERDDSILNEERAIGPEPKGDLISDEALPIDESAIDGEGRTSLHRASSEGDVDLVKCLLSRGAFCDVEDQNGDTALILASRHGHARLCELLMESGADVDHMNLEGWTALRSASWGGHLNVIETLLRYNVSVDRCSNDGRTALRAAAWGGHEDCVRILLSVGADVDKQDADGRTALMAAAYMGHADVVDILLQSGSNPNTKDRDGRTALSVATVCSSSTPVDHVGVAKLLLDRGALVDCEDNNAKTPLQCAAAEGNEAMCRLLLNKGADVDHADVNHCTPLLSSAAVGHGNVVQLLLDHGADIDSIDAEGRTVLTVAAAYGSLNVVRMLLEKGLDEMHKDNAGWTPLHHASFEGHPEVCRLLCEYNPKTVHIIDNEGRHALILAVEEGQAEVARCLIEYGANVNKPSLDGQTALRIAAVVGDKQLCHLLISRGADVDYKDLDGRSTLYALIFERQLEMAEHLLSFGTRVDNRDPQGRTALHVASWQGDLAAVELLIKYGADVDAKDNEEYTPLMLAVWRGHTAVVKCLLSHRANVNASCQQNGATSLSIAAQEGREDIVKLLLQHNADPDHSDRYGRTPTMVALKAGKEKIVDLLHDFHQNLVMPNGIATNTTLSGSSGETKASSGYMSLTQALCNSLESPFATVNFKHTTSPTVPGCTSAIQSCSKNDKSFNLRPNGSLSNKSTLSSNCGSPDDDFSRRLLEHSLSKYAAARSRPTSVYANQLSIGANIGFDQKNLENENGITTDANSILDALSALLASSTTEKLENDADKNQNEQPTKEASSNRTRLNTSSPKVKLMVDNTGSESNIDSRHCRIRIVTNPNFRQSSSSCTRTVGNECSEKHNFGSIAGTGMDDRKTLESPVFKRLSGQNNGNNEIIIKKETQL